jgi:RecQ-mediated genome instability protein 1
MRKKKEKQAPKMANSSLQSQIADSLLTTKSLPVSQAWLADILSTQRVSRTPLATLTRTALFRLLSSDFTTSLSPRSQSQRLPADIGSTQIQERRVTGPVALQVLDIEDIGVSLWSQVEALERVERGEQLRGREIIRTVTRDPGGGDNEAVTNNSAAVAAAGTNAGAPPASNGTHRLVLEDAKGVRVVAIELKRVEGISIDKLPIGAKLLVNNAIVARGMMLLEPASVTLLGGKIESLDREWKGQRKSRLLEKLGERETAR